ncbi:MAG: GDP-mannose 4,6-dehydratase [Candidatus Harrisonbacteria bacterium CG10_big_fil_rev_8_21_14_0_10_40_38]|uniref:GDP-mannose 4,6-dehydratase n=1 Tax=Candidatus Harrisonbacteria bacterium CG10_big_fil_rev_8_21_14_0_10_40_38 TaxID=1974583 RepID=A0A2H0URT2_9BACT|nr:MAG: GDP-mannose 4,6-dehydratase [Candidatus Harrisonbacteria bacterium CG10_big_fil_rev_8_21_14_0_10_40_38]
MNKKRALITGITGQDGSYLADLLLEKNYDVYGLIRNPEKKEDTIAHLEGKIKIIKGDITDRESIKRAIQESNPDEVYNFAAQSFVGASWKDPIQTAEINAIGVVSLLESIKEIKKECKFFQASSSEIFGSAENVPQNEKMPLHPTNPYGVAKAYAHWMVESYRKAHGMFTTSAIFFTHESPRRRLDFVTRKITNTAVKIKLGLEKELRMGNMEPRRDWGYSKDYAEAAWLMMQQENPDDYVIATGETHSVKELVDIIFKKLELDPEKYIVIDPKFFRPVEPGQLVGDASKAKQELGWQPTVSFEKIIEMMIDEDMRLLSEK